MLAVLIGFAGSVVLASAAGARRTATSLERFEAYSRSADVEVIVGDATPAQIREFTDTDVVADVVQLRQMTGTLAGQDFLPTAAAVDDRFATAMDRARVVAGRTPNPRAPDEIGIGETLSRRLGTHVGSELRFDAYSQQQADTAVEGSDPGPPKGPKVVLHVVAIVRRPLDLDSRGASGGVLVFTPAFLDRYGDTVASISGTILRVRTRNGAADVPKAVVAARRIFGKSPMFDVQSLSIETEGARAAIDVLTVALWLFAAIAGLAVTAFIAVSVSRHIRAFDKDQPTLDALGMSRVHRVIGAAAPAAAIAGGGAALAVVGATFASPLFPTGVARKAEPDLGFRLDWAVLGFGFPAVAICVMAVGLLAAVRTTRVAEDARARKFIVRRSTARAATRAHLPPATATGVEFALDPGRGARASPVRSAFVGTVLGTVGIAAALVFAASLSHVVTTPRAYGWSWDVLVLARDDAQTRQQPGAPCGKSDTVVTNDRAFGAVEAVCVLNVEVDRRPVTSWSFTPLRGAIDPTTVAGRAPRSPNEIALGGKTLREIDKHIGDHVLVRSAAATVSYLIVGQVVLPSPTSIDPQPLADNAAFTGAGLTRVLAHDEPPPDFHLVTRLTPGSNLSTVPRDEDGRLKFASGPGIEPTIPIEIDRLRQVDQLPTMLAAFLALLAAVTVAHALAATVRRRGHEIAVLRTLGFSRGQVRATLASQATTFALVGLVAGIPLGILVGQRVWRAVAEGLGVSPGAQFSVAGLLIACVAALLLANGMALVAAGRALRARPAEALAGE